MTETALCKTRTFCEENFWTYFDQTGSIIVTVVSSVIRLSNLLHFGQLFKACGNNYFAQITQILGNFCKGVTIFLFSSGIIFGQLL